MPSNCYLERTSKRDWRFLYCNLPLAMLCFAPLSPLRVLGKKSFNTKRKIIKTLSKRQTAKQDVFLDHLRVIVEQLAMSWSIY